MKSRLERSILRLEPHFTSSGLLPSPYPVSVRRVVTSNIESPLFTVIVPYFIPVGIVSSNDSMTCSGVAVVHMSYSLGNSPNIQSLTAPPTTHAPYPVAHSTSKTCAKSSFSGIREGMLTPGTSASNPSSMIGCQAHPFQSIIPSIGLE